MADPAASAPARTLVLLRMLTLYPVPLGWQDGVPRRLEVVLLVLLVLGTSLLALRWERVVPVVRRHPAIAASDVAVSLAVLAPAGASSPFVAYTLTSAVLAGLLFPRVGATLLTTLLASGYLLLRTLQDGGTVLDAGAVAVVVAYALLAAAGAAFRGLHDRLAQALSMAVAAEREGATAQERNRLARDLHDGVSSTLHGLVLQSMAVARTADRSDPRVAELARDLEAAARSALAQSREVLTGLRREDDSAPLVQAIADRARAWGDRTGVTVTCTATGIADLDPASRIAALRVLDEALENVDRHADAREVVVTLTGDERLVTLQVRDDGRGLAATRPGVRDGHYGILGMTERATVAGGRLSIGPDATDDNSSRCGTLVSLELPRVPSRTIPARSDLGANA